MQVVPPLVRQVLVPPVGADTFWLTSVASSNFDREETGWNGLTICVRHESAQLLVNGGTQVQVTFQAGTSEGFKITNAYFGHAAASGDAYDFETTPVQLLFGGSATTTLAANARVTSDPVNFAIGAGKAVITSVYNDSAAADNIGGTIGAQTGFSYYYKTGSDAATVNKTGYTTDASMGGALVTKVEQLVSGSTDAASSPSVYNFIGPFNTVAQATAINADIARFEDNWKSFEQGDWVDAGSFTTPYNDIFSGGATYERSALYYVQAERVEAAYPALARAYRVRAATLAAATRDYAIANGEPTEPYRQWYQLALHYLISGNASSRAVVGDAADRNAALVATGFFQNASTAFATMRVTAHALAALLAAQKINAPSDGGFASSAGGNTWSTVLGTFLTDALGARDADGIWRYQDYGCASIFQLGLMANRLIDYDLNYSADSRIFDAIKKIEQFAWARMLAPSEKSFWYAECIDSNGSAFNPAEETPDLNNFHIGPLGYLFYRTGDTTYRDRADVLLAEASKNGFFSSYKQLSEYMEGYRYSWFRSQTPLNDKDQGVPVNTVRPTISGTQVQGNTLTCNNGTWTNTPTSHTYSWVRSKAGATVTQVATTQTYALTAADAGSKVVCNDTAVNASGAGVPSRSLVSNTIT